MILKNRTYDIIKWLVTMFLPSLTTLWLAISSIWNLPLGIPIGSTLTAITAFLGAVIGISSSKYRKGEQQDENE